ncbi:MAG: hypothetical protein IJ211_00305 [Campylobacter sp.]|nr:hypothetical protein [Campylobacter sp.]
MNNEKIMREKAEQMAKKAEAKLEQINEKARKYQERKIENFDNWNKNSKNKNSDENSNTNKRDYDKDPIVLKSYSRLFSSIASGSIFGIALYLFIPLLFIKDEILKEEWYAYLICAIGMALIEILGNFLKYYLVCVKEKNSIVLKNSKIDYFTNGKLKFSVTLDKVQLVCKSTSGHNISFGYTEFLWLFIYIVGCIFVPIFIIFPLFLPIGKRIYEICWCMAINKSFKNFNSFNSIYALICEFYDSSSGMNFFMFEDKYGLINTFNRKDYYDLREYFLTTKNINIDYLKKNYL